MANQRNQKTKLLYILEILRRDTDESHPMQAKDIIAELESRGISSERKSIYRDIEILQDYGVDIIKASEHRGYYIGEREFELPELKLLVDAVLASKFITEKKSRTLVDKIETMGSVYQGKQLHRQVVVSDRVKSEDEGIYYTIDEIYNCIDNNHRLNFQYVDWTENKELQFRHGGLVYEVSPEFLLWDNEYYYMVAYDHASGEIRHYRVDKMRNATEKELERGGRKERAEIDKSNYSRKHFGMFSGDIRTVRLRVPLSMIGIIIDRFGVDIPIRREGDYALARVDVEVSHQFYGWLTGLGGEIRVIYPDEVVDDYKRYLKGIIEKYGD